MNESERHAAMQSMMEKLFGGMSDDQKRSFLNALETLLHPSNQTETTSETKPGATTYPDRLRTFEKNSRDLSSAQPAVMKTFWGLHTTAVADGALDTKTKELIALAISVATRCDDCIAHHTYDALEAGATRDEIADALGVAVLMGGGTSVVYATHAIEALEQFAERTRE